MSGSGAPQDADRLEQAVDWHVRLAGDLASEQDWLDYTSWLEADGANRMAVDRLEVLLAELDGNIPALRERFSSEARSNVVAISRPNRAGAARRTWVLGWAGGLTALAASIAALIFLGAPEPNPSTQLRFATQIGERREVALADGSTVHLNADSVVTAKIDSTTRSVIIEHGEAYFDVTKDPRRPFVIAAGDSRVEVIGTAFSVARDAGVVTVTVERGIVAVKPVDGAVSRWVERLTPGDRLTHREGTNNVLRAVVDPATALAWRDGRLVYDDVSLTSVLSDLNRHFALRIAAENADVANLRFSGVIRLDDESDVLRRLEGFLPISAEVNKDSVVLRRKSSIR